MPVPAAPACWRRLPFPFLLLSLLAGVLLLCGAAPAKADAQPRMPRAKLGVLDLSGWNMAVDGPLRLDGEWEYYPHQLLTPDDFRADPDPPGARLYVVPGPWNRSRTDNEAMGDDDGFATLRLRLKPSAGTPRPALALYNVNAAFRLWIDGRLAAFSGTLGQDEAGEIPKPSTSLAPFTNNGSQTEIILHVSNHHYRDGGLMAPVWLGPLDVLKARQDQDMGAAMFFVGSFCVMGLYHAALYWFRRSSPAPLYFSLYCFAWMGNYAASDSSNWVLRLFLPDLSAPFLDRLALACFFFTIPVGYAFLKTLFPDEFSRRLQWMCNLTCAVFMGIAAFCSLGFMSSALPLYYLFSSVLIIYCLQRMYRAWRNGRDEAALLFLGFFVLGFSGLNDMLTDMKFLDSTPLIATGMLAFSLVQAFALSRRFSRAFAAEERLAGALEEKNRHLEAEMAERNRLEQEIVAVSEEERRRISQELHDGLCQGLTAARLRCDALAPALAPAAGEAGGSAPLARLSGLLDELVDHAYDLSRGLWPLEHDGVGIGPSFREMIARLADTAAVPVSFERQQACPSCRNPHMVQLYRIGQEAVANALKHARATHIQVSLTCEGGNSAVLSVRDDGQGLGASGGGPGGLGLGIMAHRARIIGGELRVENAQGGGTLVTCTVPCPDQPSSATPGNRQVPR